MVASSIKSSLMEYATSADAILARLKTGTGAKSDTDLGAKLGFGQQSVSNARKAGKVPDAWIRKAAERFNISSDWILFGVGDMFRGDEQAQPRNEWEDPPLLPPSTETDPWKSTKWQEVPVIGLAACDVVGWFNPSPLAFRIPLTVEHPYTPELFAVIAVGYSMQPEGIRQGYVLFCDPGMPIDIGDVIYIETTDGSAAVKKLIKRDDEQVVVQGWLDPDADGAQRPFTVKLPRSHVRRMAPVIVVKRKA